MDRADRGPWWRSPGLLLLAFVLTLAACGEDKDKTQAKVAAAAPSEARSIDTRPFPRTYAVDGKEYEVHQPQLDSWDGRTLKGKFALAVKTGTKPGADGKEEALRDFGVVWFSTTTQIDTAARMVVLTDMVFERASFPTAIAREAEYLQVVRAIPGRGATWTMSVDHLEAGLAATTFSAMSRPVRNVAPDIIFSTEPAILLLVDGEPVRRAAGEGIERVINTRSLLLAHGGAFYTKAAGHWASAPLISGPWTWIPTVDAALETARTTAGTKVDTFDEPTPALEKAFADGGGPAIHVRLRPAELISVQGEPEFVQIPDTGLSYIDNTGADVFIDEGHGNAWFVLMSGRWFTAASSRGPWTYVAGAQLPPDFARIPPEHPKSGVLASIPGTPESREALIANAIPQTATVERGSATLEVPYDGEPKFVPIEGTQLEYAHNSPVPVIHVPGTGYYALDKGVWFTGKAPTGPWAVADQVPAEIYAIPTSSPLHYVTYVQVYGGKGDEVYVGYTPGYYGTVVSDDVVVYGTGYEYDDWSGDEWYGYPVTYGMGTYFGWNPWSGWTYGWGWGWYDGWYGGYSPIWGPWRAGQHPLRYWDGGATSWNVYDNWGRGVVRGTAAAWVDRDSRTVGKAVRGDYYNSTTGVQGGLKAAAVTDRRTGRTTAAGKGMLYDPASGRAIGGAGIAASGARGAAGIGRFEAQGSRGEVSGVAGFHYNAATETMHHGSVGQANGNTYASRDGQVYRYSNGEWSPVNLPRDAPATPVAGEPALAFREGGEQSSRRGDGSRAGDGNAGAGSSRNGGRGGGGYASGDTRRDLDRQRGARDRGYQRSSRDGGRSSGGGGSSSRPVGGYRSSLGGGGGRSGGGARSGGGRRG